MWFALLAACAIAPACGSDRRFVSFGGGPPGGAFFPAAAAIATYLDGRIPGVQVSVEASGGSGENVRLVASGETPMAIAYGADIDAGYRGTDDFAGDPQTSLRGIGLAFWSYGHVVALDSSGIRAIEDLAGRRVAIGGVGTGSALAGERYFRHIGLFDRMTPVYLGGTAASSALKDGQVDAYHWQSAAPNAAVLDTASTHRIVIVDMAEAASASGFLAEYPAYTRGEIPAGTYPGVDRAVATVMTGAYWIVHKDVPDALVYDMVRTAYSSEGRAHMRQVFQPLRDMTVAQARRGLTVPVHPGAMRFWAEHGRDTDDPPDPPGTNP